MLVSERVNRVRPIRSNTMSKRTPARVRNPVARSPLMRKGGVHQRAKSSKRFSDKQQLRRETVSYWNKQNGDESPRFFMPAGRVLLAA